MSTQPHFKGETAAGSRLAHLLQILVSDIESSMQVQPRWSSYGSVPSAQDIENVLVVVTRWFGGVHLVGCEAPGGLLRIWTKG